MVLTRRGKDTSSGTLRSGSSGNLSSQGKHSSTATRSLRDKGKGNLKATTASWYEGSAPARTFSGRGRGRKRPEDFDSRGPSLDWESTAPQRRVPDPPQVSTVTVGSPSTSRTSSAHATMTRGRKSLQYVPSLATSGGRYPSSPAQGSSSYMSVVPEDAGDFEATQVEDTGPLSPLSVTSYSLGGMPVPSPGGRGALGASSFTMTDRGGSASTARPYGARSASVTSSASASSSTSRATAGPSRRQLPAMTPAQARGTSSGLDRYAPSWSKPQPAPAASPRGLNPTTTTAGQYQSKSPAPHIHQASAAGPSSSIPAPAPASAAYAPAQPISAWSTEEIERELARRRATGGMGTRASTAGQDLLGRAKKR